MSRHLRPRDLGTVLGVWAHPDDEAYLSAGLMALAADAGSRVVVATATYGEQGTPDPDAWPPDRLAALRTVELAGSLAMLGVDEHHWLGFADGACASLSPGVGAARVGAVVRAVRPDTILTFGPDGMTGHPDHRAVSDWARAAWRADGGRARLLHAVVTPEYDAEWGEANERLGVSMDGTLPPAVPVRDLAVHLQLTGPAADRKLAALRAQASQTSGLIEAMGVEQFQRWCSTESFVAVPPEREMWAAAEPEMGSRSRWRRRRAARV